MVDLVDMLNCYSTLGRRGLTIGYSGFYNNFLFIEVERMESAISFRLMLGIISLESAFCLQKCLDCLLKVTFSWIIVC